MKYTSTSKYGTGKLIFLKNNSFISKTSKHDDILGFYKLEDNNLKMKYDDSEDTVVMKVNYLDKKHLLISTIGKSKYTWFYKSKKNEK